MTPVAAVEKTTSRRGSPERGASRQGENDLLAAAVLNVEEVLRKLDSSERGLAAEEIERRREIFGPNLAEHKSKRGPLGELFLRFKNPLVIQLSVIALVSLAMGDKRSAAVVGVMLILSVALAYIQESRSAKAVERLMALVKTTCIVIREGRETVVRLAEIVPGDIVALAAGSIIPADVRLMSAKDFFVSQSALTGESMPVEKSHSACETAGKAALELPNLCFQGSNVLSGTARGLVINTGGRTYFGAISQTLSRDPLPTSFDRGIKDFTWLMIRFMVVMIAVIFVLVGVTKGQWTEAFLFALAVAVGLTPEMLPMIVTVNLSKGALAMSKKGAIVKRLNSIQNFGAMDILCTDKTGTLTQNKIVLEKHTDVTSKESDDVLRYAYMNSYYQTGLRNLLDQAILAHKDLDVERSCRKVDEIPFDFQRRRMSVVIETGDEHVLICKGAVEEVFAACSHYQVDEEIYPLIEMLKKDLLEEYEAMSAQGFRVLAIAYKDFPKTKETFSTADESDLILLGYVAFFDPPKDSVPGALEALRRSGVTMKILTGDNALVTAKVCHDVGLSTDEMLTGEAMRNLSEEELSEAAERVTAFVKISPSQKEDIIRALQRRGHVVGFLGDGINDAPALKAADVGISVDAAVDVAKESADIILLKKSLLVLDDGIKEGRKVFGNIIKYIRMGASSNFGNTLSMIGASCLLPFLPMAPIQVLVNNLLYDFSQVAIPFDRVDEDFVDKPRRWDIGLIKKFMLYLGPVSSLFDYATFALMLYFFHCHDFSLSALAGPAKAHLERLFQSGWFVESLMTQTLVVHIIRTKRIPFLQSSASLPLIASTIVVMAAAAALPYSPLASTLGMVPLPRSYWFWLAAILLGYGALAHWIKTIFFRVCEAD